MSYPFAFPFLLGLCLLGPSPARSAEGPAHEHGAAEEGGVHLGPEQMQRGGIQVRTLRPQPLTQEIRAPGEVTLDRYATLRVTPRIQAQVVARHARLGEHVKKGQRLVTLSSVAMAEAQSKLLSAENDWRRVRKLGRQVVSERSYEDARIAAQEARARLLAYGMSAADIARMARGKRVDRADGRFDLHAGIPGTVIEDDFVIGQMVRPGDPLFLISDESRLWVEARIEAGRVRRIAPGARAWVRVAGRWVEGRVAQIHHSLDRTTRTLGVRIEVPNPDDRLHPGEFVAVRIAAGAGGAQGLVLPESAVLRSPDGDWQVFVEHEPGEFEPREVEVTGRSGDGLVVEGITPGTRVVTRGAFFVQSELAKSGFAVHNH